MNQKLLLMNQKLLHFTKTTNISYFNFTPFTATANNSPSRAIKIVIRHFQRGSEPLIISLGGTRRRFQYVGLYNALTSCTAYYKSYGVGTYASTTGTIIGWGSSLAFEWCRLGSHVHVITRLRNIVEFHYFHGILCSWYISHGEVV